MEIKENMYLDIPLIYSWGLCRCTGWFMPLLLANICHIFIRCSSSKIKLYKHKCLRSRNKICANEKMLHWWRIRKKWAKYEKIYIIPIMSSIALDQPALFSLIRDSPTIHCIAKDQEPLQRDSYPLCCLNYDATTISNFQPIRLLDSWWYKFTS